VKVAITSAWIKGNPELRELPGACSVCSDHGVSCWGTASQAEDPLVIQRHTRGWIRRLRGNSPRQVPRYGNCTTRARPTQGQRLSLAETTSDLEPHRDRAAPPAASGRILMVSLDQLLYALLSGCRWCCRWLCRGQFARIGGYYGPGAWKAEAASRVPLSSRRREFLASPLNPARIIWLPKTRRRMKNSSGHS